MLRRWPGEHGVSSQGPRLTAVMREGERVTPLELFFDLVFVLALTQCTTLMVREPTCLGMLKGMLVLGMLWWSWVGYAWLTSVVDPEEGSVRLVMFAAMAALLVAALCVPGAFGAEALLFAFAYAAVRARTSCCSCSPAARIGRCASSVLGLAASTAIGVGLLFVAAFTSGAVQLGLWGSRWCWTRAGRSCSAPMAGSSSRAFRRAPRGDHDHRAGRVDRRDRRRREGHARRRRRSCRRARGRGRRGAVVGVLRRGGDRRRQAPCEGARRDASATRSRATPTPTCTSRWSPASP